MRKANLHQDGVDLEEVGSYDYLNQEWNVRHDLQADIARQRADG